MEWLTQKAYLPEQPDATATQDYMQNIWIGVGLASVLLVWTNFSILKGLWMYRHIPGPIPLPFIGNLLSVKNGNIDVVYATWYKQYGPVFKWFMGTNVVIAMNEVELVREVGLKKFSSFMNRPKLHPKSIEPLLVKEMQDINEYGLLRARNQYWKGLRSTSASIFHSVETLASFTPLMKVTANELAERLNNVKEGEVIDIWRALGDMTLDVVGSTVFGVRFNAVKSEDNEAVKAARVIFANAGFMSNPYILLAYMAPFLVPFLKLFTQLFPTKNMKEARWALDTLTRFSYRMVEDAKCAESGSFEDFESFNKERAKINENAPAGLDIQYVGENFLKLFLQNHNRETGEVLSKKEINAQAFIFTLAGYETTANTLAISLYLLAKNKEKETALINEIDRYKSSELPSLEELKKYEYVEAVLKEGLRMFGPTPLTDRECSQNTEIKEHMIYKNSRVHIGIQNLHSNAKYFPNPDQFIPERFIPSSSVYKEQNHQAFMPWGLGPRMCVASNFALVEAKLALITLFRQFTFSLKSSDDLKFTFGVTRNPQNGVQVFVHKRA